MVAVDNMTGVAARDSSLTTTKPVTGLGRGREAVCLVEEMSHWKTTYQQCR